MFLYGKTGISQYPANVDLKEFSVKRETSPIKRGVSLLSTEMSKFFQLSSALNIERVLNLELRSKIEFINETHVYPLGIAFIFSGLDNCWYLAPSPLLGGGVFSPRRSEDRGSKADISRSSWPDVVHKERECTYPTSAKEVREIKSRTDGETRPLLPDKHLKALCGHLCVLLGRISTRLGGGNRLLKNAGLPIHVPGLGLDPIGLPFNVSASLAQQNRLPDHTANLEQTDQYQPACQPYESVLYLEILSGVLAGLIASWGGWLWAGGYRWWGSLVVGLALWLFLSFATAITFGDLYFWRVGWRILTGSNPYQYEQTDYRQSFQHNPAIVPLTQSL